MSNNWTDIVRQSALETQDPVLPADDFAQLEKAWGAHRRRKLAAWIGGTSAGAFAVMAAVAVIMWPKADVGGVMVAQNAEDSIIPEPVVLVEDADAGEMMAKTPSCGQAFIRNAFAEEQTAAPQDFVILQDEEKPLITEQTVEKTDDEVAPDKLENVQITYPEPQLMDIVTVKPKRKARFALSASGSISNSIVRNSAPQVVLAPAVVKLSRNFAAESSPQQENKPVSYAHMPLPFEFGLNLSWDVMDKLQLTSGLQYTLLISNCGMPDMSFAQQRVHYLGIPLTASYIHHFGRYFSLYAGGGCLVEKCIYANRGNQRLYEKGLQFAISASAGAQVDIGRHFGLFAEPQFRYYLTKSEFTTRRSTSPFCVGINLGLRLKI